MSTILTEQQMKMILADLQFVIKDIASRHNIRVDRVRTVYSKEGSITLTTELSVIGGKDKLALQYERYQKSLGLPVLGWEFMHKGKVAKTCGLRVGGPYKTVVWEVPSTGKKYKLGFEEFKAMYYVVKPLKRI